MAVDIVSVLDGPDTPDGKPYATGEDGNLYPITRMFVFDGLNYAETTNLEEADQVVIKFGKDDWGAINISNKVAGRQGLN